MLDTQVEEQRYITEAWSEHTITEPLKSETLTGTAEYYFYAYCIKTW